MLREKEKRKAQKGLKTRAIRVNDYWVPNENQHLSMLAKEKQQ